MSTRITRGSEPGTGISRAHSSGTRLRPRRRAATAGNSALRSSVSVKMQLTTLSTSSAFRFMISRMSHSVAPTIASASLRSTVVAPRRAWSRAIALGCCQIALLALGCGGDSGAPAPPAAPARIVVTSAWRDGATIPVRFTCSGAGARPPVAWRGVPRGARELVLVVTDPDAPGGRFVHWTAYGIAPGARAMPRRVREGRNSAGKTGWTPPCPPKGDRPHRAVVALDALAQAADRVVADRTARDAGPVGLGHLEARVGQPVRELAVVGEQDQPGAVGVQAPDRVQPSRAARGELDDGGPGVGVARRGDHAPGLVHRVDDALARRAQRLAVERAAARVVDVARR